MMMITETTDGKHVGLGVKTDFMQPIAIPNSNVRIKITGRMHRGSGRWRVWNENYFLELTEMPNG